MPASGLLISCAIDAASRPSDESFSDLFLQVAGLHAPHTLDELFDGTNDGPPGEDDRRDRQPEHREQRDGAGGALERRERAVHVRERDADFK